MTFIPSTGRSWWNNCFFLFVTPDRLESQITACSDWDLVLDRREGESSAERILRDSKRRESRRTFLNLGLPYSAMKVDIDWETREVTITPSFRYMQVSGTSREAEKWDRWWLWCIQQKKYKHCMFNHHIKDMVISDVTSATNIIIILAWLRQLWDIYTTVKGISGKYVIYVMAWSWQYCLVAGSLTQQNHNRYISCPNSWFVIFT